MQGETDLLMPAASRTGTGCGHAGEVLSSMENATMARRGERGKSGKCGKCDECDERDERGEYSLKEGKDMENLSGSTFEGGQSGTGHIVYRNRPLILAASAVALNGHRAKGAIQSDMDCLCLSSPLEGIGGL